MKHRRRRKGVYFPGRPHAGGGCGARAAARYIYCGRKLFPTAATIASASSSLIASGGAMVNTLPSPGTVSLFLPTSTPPSRIARWSATTSRSGIGVRLLSAMISNPMSSPRPRTSPIRGESSARRRSASRAPTRAAFSQSRSRVRISRFAKPAAQEQG